MRTRKTPSLVAITHDGKVYFGSDQINPDDLTSKVKDRIANKTTSASSFNADARARYGKVVEVVDDIRSAGVDDVGLADRPEESEHQASPAATSERPSKKRGLALCQ